MLREAKGNMYDFVTHTWNAIKGKCSHDCSYCYMKEFGKLNPIRLDNKELNTDLGSGNYIFVGSSTDMFADDVPEEWIIKVLDYCKKFDNTYLFQTKNVNRIILEFIEKLPKDVVIATTIETNRIYKEMGNTDTPIGRALGISWCKINGYKTMITIEPILDFDVKEFSDMIITCNPDYLNIGADSKEHNLPEPSKEKLLEFIKILNDAGIKIHNKKNLARLLE